MVWIPTKFGGNTSSVGRNRPLGETSATKATSGALGHVVTFRHHSRSGPVRLHDILKEKPGGPLTPSTRPHVLYVPRDPHRSLERTWLDLGDIAYRQGVGCFHVAAEAYRGALKRAGNLFPPNQQVGKRKNNQALTHDVSHFIRATFFEGTKLVFV